jgi:hypothetical protein
MGESTNGTPLNKFTTSTAFTHSTWYKIKITRTTAGITTYYALGGTEYPSWTIIPPVGGTGNPFTDTSITTSAYFVMLFAAGTKIANVIFKPLA